MYRKLTKPQHKDMPTWCAELHPNWTMDVRTAGSNSYTPLNKVRILLERELLPYGMKNVENELNFIFCTKVNYTLHCTNCYETHTCSATLSADPLHSLWSSWKSSCMALRSGQLFCTERLYRISWQSNTGTVARHKWRADGRDSFQIRKQCLKTKITDVWF
jgi:hypothetical protein